MVVFFFRLAIFVDTLPFKMLLLYYGRCIPALQAEVRGYGYIQHSGFREVSEQDSARADAPYIAEERGQRKGQCALRC